MATELLPTYLGNCEIEETERSEIEVDAFGLDSFTQNYQGRKDKVRVNAFLKLLKAKATHDAIGKRTLSTRAAIAAGNTGFSGMSVKGFNFYTDRSWAYFTVRFSGKADNSEPPPSTSYGLNENTLQCVIAGDQTPIPAEIDYLSPTRTHRYAARVAPKIPRYNKDKYFANSIQLIAKRGAAEVLEQSQLNVDQRSFLVSFNRDQSGVWWACEETYEVRLVQNFKTSVVILGGAL